MSYSKESPKHWMERLQKRNADSADWHVRPSFKREQRWINLGTSNKTEAAKRAVEVWMVLKDTQGDWNAARKAAGQILQKTRNGATVGEWIAAFLECPEINVDPRTVGVYAGCLRRVTAHVAKITHEAFPRRKDWRAAVEEVPLATLTTRAIKQYMADKLRGVPREKLDDARRGLHTDLRNARNLFTAKRLAAIPLVAPSPAPFSEIDVAPHRPRRFKSSIKVPAILRAARKELDASQQAALILFACAGLRKEECDKLLWSQVTLGGDNPHIEIKETWCYKPKSLSSHRLVPLASEVAQFLSSIQEEDAEFVLAGVPPRLGLSYFHYRARASFEKLGPWLRSKGVEHRQPLHAFRKEFGSAINRQAGLHAAMEALGHSDISVTSSTYVEHRERVTVGFDS